MIKIRLLNKSGFSTISGVEFPIVVEGNDQGINGCLVLGAELIKFGFDFIVPNECYYFSKLQGECEVVKPKRCKAIRQGDQMQCVCGLAWDIDDTDLPECREC